MRTKQWFRSISHFSKYLFEIEILGKHDFDFAICLGFVLGTSQSPPCVVTDARQGPFSSREDTHRHTPFVVWRFLKIRQKNMTELQKTFKIHEKLKQIIYWLLDRAYWTPPLLLVYTSPPVEPPYHPTPANPG